jgi:hypothetical protein
MLAILLVKRTFSSLVTTRSYDFGASSFCAALSRRLKFGQFASFQ